MTREDIDNIISVICPNDEDYEKPIISPAYLKNELEALALEQEPCEDAVSRAEALKGYIEVERADGVEIYSDKVVPIEYINNLPPVTPQPKTGRWVWCAGSHQCSNCKEYTCFSHKKLLRYCPNCGARMVESQESEDKE